MDIITYQETMRLLAKIDQKARKEKEEKEQELTPYETFKGIVLILILFGIFSLSCYLD